MKSVLLSLEKDLGVDPNTIATIFITLLVFIVGIMFQFLAVEFRNWHRRKNKRRIFSLSLKRHLKDIDQQLEGFVKSRASLSFSNRSRFLFYHNVLMPPDSFHNLDYQSIYNAYFTGIENWFRSKKRLKSFSEIWHALESLEFWSSAFIDLKNSFIEKYNLEGEKRTDAIEKYRSFLQEKNYEFDNVSIPKELHNYLRVVFQIHSEWTKLTDRTSPEICHRQLVIRNRILYKKYHHLKDAGQINDAFLDATTHYIEQRNCLLGTIESLRIYEKVFRYDSKRIRCALIRLNSNFTKYIID